MTSALSYSNAWFGNNNTATGAPSGVSRAANFLVATTMLVGTGAFLDDQQLAQKSRAERVIESPSRLPIIDVAATRSPSEDIERIRDVLSPGVSTLSSVFQVSRQTIYNWLKGEQPKPEHIAKMRDLAQAADLLASAGIPINGSLMKRKIRDGKNLLEIARDDGTARDAAQLLVQIVQKETLQRDALASRLAGRKGSYQSVESDFPPVNG